MLIIKHRINTLKELQETPINFGIEADVQMKDNEIYLGHDPGDTSEKLIQFMSGFKHRMFAVNIKQEGIEENVISILKDFSCERFFLFDLSFPKAMSLIWAGESRIALRISDFESLQEIDFLSKNIDWLWIDTFLSPNFLKKTLFSKFKNTKKCLVSPELHSYRSKELTEEILSQIKSSGVKFDAVCTKKPEIWENL